MVCKITKYRTRNAIEKKKKRNLTGKNRNCFQTQNLNLEKKKY